MNHLTSLSIPWFCFSIFAVVDEFEVPFMMTYTLSAQLCMLTCLLQQANPTFVRPYANDLQASLPSYAQPCKWLQMHFSRVMLSRDAMPDISQVWSSLRYIALSCSCQGHKIKDVTESTWRLEDRILKGHNCNCQPEEALNKAFLWKQQKQWSIYIQNQWPLMQSCCYVVLTTTWLLRTQQTRTNVWKQRCWSGPAIGNDRFIYCHLRKYLIYSDTEVLG